MALKIFDTITNYKMGRATPGSEKYPFLGSPLPITLLTLAYMIFVLKLGPAYMKNRKPFNIKNWVLVYNFLQVVSNLVLFIYSSYLMSYHKLYNIGCCEQLPADHAQKPNEFMICYIYYIIKILDYIDTVIFVLRKSFRQISFLHVYHHVFMAFGGYFLFRLYGEGGHLISVGFFNTIVHAVMYSYYFLTALRPDLKNSLWWKKHITQMQITQFVLVFLHQLYPILFRPDCKYPRELMYLGLIQAVILMILFGNFYIRNYIMPSKTKKLT